MSFTRFTIVIFHSSVMLACSDAVQTYLLSVQGSFYVTIANHLEAGTFIVSTFYDVGKLIQ